MPGYVLSSEELWTLHQYAKIHKRPWKAMLRKDWRCGDYRKSPHLREPLEKLKKCWGLRALDAFRIRRDDRVKITNLDPFGRYTDRRLFEVASAFSQRWVPEGIEVKIENHVQLQITLIPMSFRGDHPTITLILQKTPQTPLRLHSILSNNCLRMTGTFVTEFGLLQDFASRMVRHVLRWEARIQDTPNEG